MTLYRDQLSYAKHHAVCRVVHSQEPAHLAKMLDLLLIWS